jgi:hypothetical protein
LYPSKKSEDNDETTENDFSIDTDARGDRDIWEKIEEAMTHGQRALETIRDEAKRKKTPNAGAPSNQAEKRAKPPASKSVPLPGSVHHGERGNVLEGDAASLDSGSEDGFFE